MGYEQKAINARWDTRKLARGEKGLFVKKRVGFGIVVEYTPRYILGCFFLGLWASLGSDWCSAMH